MGHAHKWELKTDKPAYIQDELVTLTFTVTNPRRSGGHRRQDGAPLP